MPVTTPTVGQAYPSIEDVFNSVRVHINDTFKGATGTLGEGRIFVDTWTPAITILNLALQRFARDLEDMGVATAHEEVFILQGDTLGGGALTAINGPNGLGAPDPSLQVFLNFEGYWDGQTLNKQIHLPFDLLIPLSLEERVSGTGSQFVPLGQCNYGLQSLVQYQSLGGWEWRGDGIFMNGSTVPMDLRIRYTSSFPRFPLTLKPKDVSPLTPQFNNTLIPFLDAQEPLSYLVAYMFCAPRLPQNAAGELMANYKDCKDRIANRSVKQSQAVVVARQPFGNEDSGWSWW